MQFSWNGTVVRIVVKIKLKSSLNNFQEDTEEFFLLKNLSEVDFAF